MKVVTVTALASLLLAGCQSTGSVPAPLLNTSPYKGKVARFLYPKLMDPGSVRDAAISLPYPAKGQGETLVCVRFNAKNGFGGYTGQTDTAVLMRGMEPYSVLPVQDEQCSLTQMQPFPELGKL